MSMTDPIADMLTRIRNAVRAQHDALALEADLFGAISSTGEMKEGMAAVLEKRKPSWIRGS